MRGGGGGRLRCAEGGGGGVGWGWGVRGEEGRSEDAACSLISSLISGLISHPGRGVGGGEKGEGERGVGGWVDNCLFGKSRSAERSAPCAPCYF